MNELETFYLAYCENRLHMLYFRVRGISEVYYGKFCG